MLMLVSSTCMPWITETQTSLLMLGTTTSSVLIVEVASLSEEWVKTEREVLAHLEVEVAVVVLALLLLAPRLPLHQFFPLALPW